MHSRWKNTNLRSKIIDVTFANVTTDAEQLALAGKANEGQLRPQIDSEDNYDKRVSTNATELSLAGKGFNSAVEAAYEDEFDEEF